MKWEAMGEVGRWSVNGQVGGRGAHGWVWISRAALPTGNALTSQHNRGRSGKLLHSWDQNVATSIERIFLYIPMYNV